MTSMNRSESTPSYPERMMKGAASLGLLAVCTACAAGGATGTSPPTTAVADPSSTTSRADLAVVVECGAPDDRIAAGVDELTHAIADGNRVRVRIADSQNADVFKAVPLGGLDGGRLPDVYATDVLLDGRANALKPQWQSELEAASSGVCGPVDIFGGIENAVAAGSKTTVVILAHGGVSTDAGTTHDLLDDMVAPSPPVDAAEMRLIVVGVGQLPAAGGGLVVDPSFTGGLKDVYKDYVSHFAVDSMVVGS